ncbi:hypothetical protein TWF173_003107 [Orbilia oligospora]|uniref:Uncharacterized protein n=2 Tax=Orbilia oligospora TaxID=2813651 RepID=G1XI49_ARTOA|nr:hypothetical protein AOL_s00097g26 [Orbilia oligospora ATCC 24927]EGX47187.1 hypothetical protein AOL_s00097g26 [Orbilia oligospora ATCC 24927]KAF3270123.1 hypothetical protein TWF970_010806 [Orbilia oligospora]KAF3315911.1 hypothetical protein TWF173_003107 [Orbilia oligospora]
MQQKFIFVLLSLLSATAVNADKITIQAPITGCEGNEYCTGFQECGRDGFCHRRESCGNWGGRQNVCCYTDNSTTCADLAGDFLLNSFNLDTSGTEAVYAKRCPQGTVGTTYDYKTEGFACCPPGSDIIIEVEAQNATFLEPSVPLKDKYTEIINGRCVGAGFSDSASSPSPSGTEGGETSTPTGASGTSSPTPNSASSITVSAVFGLTFLALAWGSI